MTMMMMTTAVAVRGKGSIETQTAEWRSKSSAADIQKKSSASGDRLVMANQADFPVRSMCRVLDVYASRFCTWRERASSQRSI
jgi:hypothetical protein